MNNSLCRRSIECIVTVKLEGIFEKTGTDRRTRTRTYGKDGHLWKRRALMEKTGTYGKDGHLWKRRTLLEKTGTYGKDGHLWKRRALTVEKTDMCVYILN